MPHGREYGQPQMYDDTCRDATIATKCKDLMFDLAARNTTTEPADVMWVLHGRMQRIPGNAPLHPRPCITYPRGTVARTSNATTTHGMGRKENRYMQTIVATALLLNRTPLFPFHLPDKDGGQCT